MIAAISPANASPVTPTGSMVVTSVGNTMWASGRSGTRMIAIAPGSTVAKSGRILRKPPSCAPRCVLPMSFAPGTRWTMC